MYTNTIIFSVFLIFSGAAVLASVALYARQSLLVAYILVGILLGPSGLGWISDSSLIQRTGDVGILFLLFLLGLHLQPQSLWNMLKKVTWVALISSLAFFLVGAGLCYAFGYDMISAIVVGSAMMFSSTIIGLKLLPTTILHHQHTGEVMIGILLMQDFIAIIALLLLHGASIEGGVSTLEIIGIFLAFPALLLFAFLFEHFILIRLLARFDRVREYMFLLSIAWCLALSELAAKTGLSHEVGAFIAGVTLAASPISSYIAESLKPVRDFFLVIFFFSVGAAFNTQYLPQVLWSAILLASAILILKPLLFRWLLHQVGESRHVSWEVGFRLGQISEFSLLLVYLADKSSLVGSRVSHLVQATAMITFIVSSYLVVRRYPTPVGVLRRVRSNPSTPKPSKHSTHT